MRRYTNNVLAVCSVLLVSHAAAAEPGLDAIAPAIQQNADRRPRLLVDGGTFERVNRSAEHDPVARQMVEDVLADAETMLPQPPLERKMIGRRLLDVSRTALHRIATLAMAYRLTDDERFLHRAEQEMLAVCAFDDWNPSHFLDVAEMTAGLAIGYDWLYADLAPDVRRRIREAIVDKGLKPSLEGRPGWVSVPNNWNQVCNGGLTAGALAVMEDEPEIAARIVHRAVENVPIAMRASYAPAGTYPRAWLLVVRHHLQRAGRRVPAQRAGTDFGLADEPGFDKTAGFFNQAIGPAACHSLRRLLALEDWLRAGRLLFAAEFDTPWWQQRTDQLLAGDREGLRGVRFGWLAPLWREAGLGSGFFPTGRPVLQRSHPVGKESRPLPPHRPSTSWASARSRSPCTGAVGPTRAHCT